jgi:dTDP-4-dehydrorhamnose reductase
MGLQETKNLKRILLLGSRGQIGQELQISLIPVAKVIPVDRTQLDVTNHDALKDCITAVKPDLIVNATAYTAVDQAESEPELAQAINAIAPTIMAQEAEKLGATLIHISTDYVFDGLNSSPYLEDHPTHPLNLYGQSKLAGELGIQKNASSYLILRTAWVYGTYGKSNFVKTMLRLGSQREQIRVVADQIGSPTWAKDIAEAIAALIVREGRRQEAGGRREENENRDNSVSLPQSPTDIYHFTNSGVASWYDFAIAIFEEAKLLGFPLQVQDVIPITTADYPTPAQRPAYSVLACGKISALLETYPAHWRTSLRQMLKQLSQTNL